MSCVCHARNEGALFSPGIVTIICTVEGTVAGFNQLAGCLGVCSKPCKCMLGCLLRTSPAAAVLHMSLL